MCDCDSPVNVITENLFYIYLYYPATYQVLFGINIFNFTKLNNYPLQLIIYYTLNIVGIFSWLAYNAVTVNRMCVKNFQQENSNETFHVRDVYKAYLSINSNGDIERKRVVTDVGGIRRSCRVKSKDSSFTCILLFLREKKEAQEKKYV